MCSPPSPTRAVRASSAPSRPRNWPARPATPGRTVHCGPGGIFVFALGGADGNDGPGGVALLDHDTFDVIAPGRWTGASSSSATTDGGTWVTTPSSPPSGRPRPMVEDGLN